MNGIRHWRIPAFPLGSALSLCWINDELTDFTWGCIYNLDGSFRRIPGYGWRFNCATVSPGGDYVVLYGRNETKGIILHHGKILREINRSYRGISETEFPVTLFRLADGRDVMAHCPDHYGTIEIEDVVTGQRLTNASSRHHRDIFHSRFAVNSAGTLLLSAGWIWHPLGTIDVFSIEDALKDSSTLDQASDITPPLWAELCAAAFHGDSALILSTTSEGYDNVHGSDEGWGGDMVEPHRLRLALYDLEEKVYRTVVHVGEPTGTLMPLSDRYAIGFYDHPKIFDLITGHIVHRWPGLYTGKQESAIVFSGSDIPPLALDPANSRFAVADKDGITVVEIDPHIEFPLSSS